MNLNKFQDSIKERVVDKAARQAYTGGEGMVVDYNKQTNTAVVLMTKPGSTQAGETLKNVTCPTNTGVQGVAPEVGTLCWVVFKDGTQSRPMIIAFYKPNYEEIEYYKQYEAISNTPRYLMDM